MIELIEISKRLGRVNISILVGRREDEVDVFPKLNGYGLIQPPLIGSCLISFLPDQGNF